MVMVECAIFHAEFWNLVFAGDFISCFPYYQGVRRSVFCKYSHLFSLLVETSEQRRLYKRARNDENSARRELKLKLYYLLTHLKTTYLHIVQCALSF